MRRSAHSTGYHGGPGPAKTGNLTVHGLYSKDEEKEDLHQLKASQQNKVIQRNIWFEIHEQKTCSCAAAVDTAALYKPATTKVEPSMEATRLLLNKATTKDSQVSTTTGRK